MEGKQRSHCGEGRVKQEGTGEKCGDWHVLSLAELSILYFILRSTGVIKGWKKGLCHTHHVPLEWKQRAQFRAVTWSRQEAMVTERG